MVNAEQLKYGLSLQNPQGANFRISDVPESVEYRPVNLVAEDGPPSRGIYYRKKGTKPRVGVHLMHPRTDQSQNYNILPLVEAGYGVLGRASRWPNNDTATIHEMLLLDVAAGLDFLRREGCEQTALLGNSGGSSLAAFYQAQARTQPPGRLTQTPAGDPYDLNRFKLPAADAVIFVGGHVGQGNLIGRMLDPSLLDEADPLSCNPELDMFNPDNGFRTPPESSHYPEAFLTRYKAAQLARANRLDATARRLIAGQRDAAESVKAASSLDAIKLQRAAKAGWHMIVYRTTADPAFTDLGIDPDDRCVFSYASARPDIENYGENGFARIVTPRAWLSTWSPLSTNADSIKNLGRITDPLLVLHYAGDSGTRMADAEELVARSGAADKELFVVRGADHYGNKMVNGERSGIRMTEGTSKVVEWMRQRFAP